MPRKFPKQPCVENVEGIALHSSTWQSGAKGEWRVSSWLAISNTYKTYRNFTFVQLQLEIVVKHRSLYIKILFYPLTLYWTMYFWKLFLSLLNPCDNNPCLHSDWLHGRKLPKKLTINVFCVMFRLTFIILGDTNEMERTTLRNVSRLLWAFKQNPVSR